MKSPERLTSLVDPAQSGARLDQAAAEAFPQFSRSRLQQWIRSGRLTVDGETGVPKQKLHGGERLALIPESEPENRFEPEPIALDILYQDAHVLVIDKPAGLVVHPAPGNRSGTLLNGLLHHLPALASVPRAGIVHRLDKDTSGVMVVAATLESHARLVEQLQARSVSREYLALVRGAVTGSGTVDAPLARNPRDRKTMAVVADGKRAVTHYRLKARWPGLSLLEVSLETGRTHQIRVHMTHIGHPLVGDPQYGRSRRFGTRGGLPEAAVEALNAFPRQALHARLLTFEHPGSGETVSFEAPLPDDLAGLLAALEASA